MQIQPFLQNQELWKFLQNFGNVRRENSFINTFKCMQEIPLDVIFTIFTNISGNRREGICKFMQDTMLKVARILGDIVRIQNVLEKCSEINQ